MVVHPTDEAQSEFNPALVNNEPISDVPSNYLKYVGLHAAHVGVKEVGHHADAVLPHLSEFIVINHLCTIIPVVRFVTMYSTWNILIHFIFP